MAKRPALTIKLKRNYHGKNEYEDPINDELKRILRTDDLSTIGYSHRTKVGAGKKKVSATVTFNEDGPIFGMSIPEAVSLAANIATLVGLWIQLRTPQPQSKSVTQDHYVVITNGENTFRGKPGKKRLKQIVELMAKIDT